MRKMDWITEKYPYLSKSEEQCATKEPLRDEIKPPTMIYPPLNTSDVILIKVALQNNMNDLIPELQTRAKHIIKVLLQAEIISKEARD